MISPEPSAVFRPLDTGGVILNVDNGDYFQINETGRFIWEMIEAGAERNRLVDELADRYEITSEQATADVDDFLGQLTERSLITAD